MYQIENLVLHIVSPLLRFVITTLQYCSSVQCAGLLHPMSWHPINADMAALATE